MKDVLKRVAIVGIMLIAVVVTLSYFLSKYDNSTNSTNNDNNQIIESGDSKQEVKLEQDEVEAYTEKKARVTANLNFRRSYNTQSSIICTIPKNDVVDVLTKMNNGWYKIKYKNDTGYVNGEYIKILTDEEKLEITVEKEYENTYALVDTDTYLNIRDRANKEANRLTYVNAKSILKVYAKMKNGWYKVEGNAYIGYVNGEYIKVLSKAEYEALAPTENTMLKPESNLIATYTSTSRYGESSRHNMQVAADYMNGTIVKPGETYSHLKVVDSEDGPTKYVESGIMLGNGQTGIGLGGGICQTSSTLYAAIASARDNGINTGLVVSQRAPHSAPVYYVPVDYEATVSSGSIDFAFRNVNNYSIKIEAKYDYNTLTINIYKI